MKYPMPPPTNEIQLAMKMMGDAMISLISLILQNVHQ